MKKRLGFVSNSSSSSFVIIGIKIEEENYEELARKWLTEESINDYIGDDINNYEGDEKEDWWQDLWYECAWNGNFKNSELDYISDDGRAFIGKVIASGNDYDFPGNDYDFPEGEHSFNELIEMASSLGLGDDCKLYHGTRAC